MPRKTAGRGRKRGSSYASESESEYAESSSNDDDNDEIDEDYEEEGADADERNSEVEDSEAEAVESSPLRKKAKRSAPRPAAVASRASFSRAGQPLTERGGYRHKESSKIKISQRNKGKTPWNKHKRRSGTDKAKISAGVRARNRSILLEQLKRWDMSEEEYDEVKKRIKNVREKLRRKKLENEGKASKSKRSAATEQVDTDDGEEESDEEGAKSEDGSGPRMENAEKVAPVDDIRADCEYTWDPHPFDSVDPATYPRFCPNNGPGGLICCEVCTANYSQYMSSTFQSMQQQKTSLIGKDVKDLGVSLQQTAERLEKTLTEIKTEQSTTSKRSKVR